MRVSREFYLPNFSEFRFSCFPHSAGNYNRPFKKGHNVTRLGGVRDYSLHYVAEGSGILELNGDTYQLRAGDAFWHVPHSPMRYYSSDDNPWNVYWMQMYGSTLPTFLSENGFHQSSIWTMNDSELLQLTFDELLDEIEAHNFLRPSRISALSYGVLIEFVSHAIPYSHYRSVNSSDKILALLPLMQKKAHLPFVLEAWAEQAGYTPNYFCSLFKKVTRMTPVSYMTKCRIQLSKHLLVQQPVIPIKEVAINSGYPGLSYFNKKFMASEGMTPGEFRNRHLNR
ncbi:helix-turn-helix transcriptional regulator [Paenibacillus daejeonensis]|uniref:helix-turn-helix transcriptional regulator n=1 Tax=Paenibacillus daejeonensis TaxID=135193 RepID=UPI00036AA4AE|nr:response regulator transcription factor [Paenibacillus daejeonensis]